MRRGERPDGSGAGRRTARRAGERGTVLMLVPAGVLVILVLGGFMVDYGLSHLAQRELVNLATAAADDAVVVGLDEASFQQEALLCLDPDVVRSVVEATWDAGMPDYLDAGPPEVELDLLDGRPAVTVRGGGMVDVVFSRAIPGAPNTHEVHARSTAVAWQDEDFDALESRATC